LKGLIQVIKTLDENVGKCLEKINKEMSGDKEESYKTHFVNFPRIR
jgi:hypothetical protein